MKFLNKSQQFNKIIGSPAKRAMRAGKKEGGLEEGIFARPLLLGGGWVCVAEGDAQVNQNFAQKRFALRPVIATRCNFHHFWGSLIARSPRRSLSRTVLALVRGLGSLRKFLYILGLNQKDGQNQKRFFLSSRRRFNVAKQRAK